MFTLNHHEFLPIAPRDNHPGCRHTKGSGEGVVCLNESGQYGRLAAPMICTRAAGHDGWHQAAGRHGWPGMRTLRDATSDSVPVVAEWDDDRTTDGLV